MHLNFQNKKISVPGWALNAASLALSLLVIAASLYVLLPRLSGLSRQACAPQTLTIAERQFEVKSIKMERDGSFKVPANQQGTAYWVQGTGTHPVLALSLTADNIALLTSLKAGDMATVMAGGACGGTVYALSAVRQGVPDRAAVDDQSASGITLFVQTFGSAGFTVAGTMKEAILGAAAAATSTPHATPVDTIPAPDPSILQAEISLLGVTAAPDDQTISISVSIVNTGQKAGRLSKRDVSLLDADGKSQGPEASEPPLPQPLPPGETHEFSFTFSRPASPTATLRILGVEYEIEGY